MAAPRLPTAEPPVYTAAVVWNATPLSPDARCEECKLGIEGGRGPFWHPEGVQVNVGGRMGPQGLVVGRICICKECLFLAVNAPDSPFHGVIPRAAAAEEALGNALAANRALEADLAAARDAAATLRGQVEALESTPSPALVRAVAAALGGPPSAPAPVSADAEDRSTKGRTVRSPRAA